MTTAELADFLFPHPLPEAEETLTRWMQASRRFAAFLAVNKAKVRKKLRLAQTPESLQSLLLELDIARRLVEDKRCQVEYEKYGQGRDRSPDLTVTFRENTIFHLEATRIQMVQSEAEGRAEKLIRTVCEKMGQAVPQGLNVLVIGATGGALTEEELVVALKALKRRVEQREPELLTRAHCTTPADFFKQFQWLNRIILHTAGDEPDATPGLRIWSNAQARQVFPAEIHTLLQAVLGGSE